ncbi:hypothetical protein CEXT_675491 [Caerostris extrusa]|uniref:Uncharacterized protein n=1 Tax=Caerostris extrusa TaxID=172846 RepID=A0AAV4XCN0_CAEEX|nr:hypothetical protein CEXT_675491 [Caerostris extrusa]
MPPSQFAHGPLSPKLMRPAVTRIRGYEKSVLKKEPLSSVLGEDGSQTCCFQRISAFAGITRRLRQGSN